MRFFLAQKEVNVITIIAMIVSIVGALNWILIGLFNFNLVSWICMGSVVATSIIYTIVGIAGIWLIYYLLANWKKIARHDI